MMDVGKCFAYTRVALLLFSGPKFGVSKIALPFVKLSEFPGGCQVFFATNAVHRVQGLSRERRSCQEQESEQVTNSFNHFFRQRNGCLA